MRRRFAVLLLAVLTVTGSVSAVGTAAQAAPASLAGSAAAWTGGPQNLINYKSNRCLQPTSLAANALIEQRTCDGTSVQKWRSVDAGTGYTRLVNVASQLCLDLVVNSEAEVVPGVLVQQFSCSPEYTSEEFNRTRGSRLNHFQVWTRIRTTICLEPKNRSTSNGAVIWINTCSYYENAQQFRFVDAP